VDVCVCVCVCVCVDVYLMLAVTSNMHISFVLRIHLSISVEIQVVWPQLAETLWMYSSSYGVASLRRIDEIIGLFRKTALQKRQYSAKET